MVALKWMYAAFGLMLILGSIPFLTRRVKPNPFYGYRTSRTLSDEKAWYNVNGYAALWFMAVGVMVVLAAFNMAGLENLSERAYAETVSLLMLIGLGFASLMSFRHYRKLF